MVLGLGLVHTLKPALCGTLVQIPMCVSSLVFIEETYRQRTNLELSNFGSNRLPLEHVGVGVRSSI